MDDLKLAYQKSTEAINEFYRNGNALLALTIINKVIEIYPKYPFSYQLKCDILLSLNNIEQALQCIDAGLLIAPNNYEFLRRRAQIIGFQKNDFQSALNHIAKAIALLEIESNEKMNMSETWNLIEKINYVRGYASVKADFKSIEQNLIQAQNNKKINDNIQITKDEIKKIEKNLHSEIIENSKENKKERFRNIELLGIFTAVLAFIFANMQKAPELKSFTDLIMFDLGLGIPLMLFLLVIKLIFG
jgi:tetratricopeptide (TPR) repeat protein